jgi:hypothetical protein
MTDEVKIDEKSKQKKIAWIVFFVGLILIISIGSRGPRIPDESDARVMCELQIKSLLKAPQSASFSYGQDVKVNGQGAGPYVVKGYVEAQNSFGVMLRNNYVCNLKFEGTTAIFSEARLF